MMKQCIYWITVLLLLPFTSCTDELFIQDNETGKTVTVTSLKFVASGASKTELTLTRADSHSEVREVTLFVFTSGILEGSFDVPYANLSETGNTDDRNRTYTITSSITVTTGQKKIYAVANASTAPYWQNCLADLKTINNEEAFKQHLFSINQSLVENHSLPLLNSGIVPLFGYGDVEIVEGQGNQGNASGEIHVKRPVAHVTFNIYTTSINEKGNTCIFTPRNYTVHNVAIQSPVIEMDKTSLDPENDMRTYYNTNSENVPAAAEDENKELVSTFAFYIPENMQQNATGINSYHERDQWDPKQEPVKGEEKYWTYAPPKSSYIVITGQYTETDPSNALVYQGDVSYTIHLGDFSNDQWENFSVQRNYRYTYTVKVAGVDEIIAEATTEKDDDYGNQPGAEGDIIGNATASQVFDLDCHYEQAYVYYDLTAIANELSENGTKVVSDELIGNSFILKSSTPFASNSDYIAPYYRNKNNELESDVTKDMDYKWIYFLSQKDDNSISAYPGDQCKDKLASSEIYGENKYLINPYQLCVSLGKLTRMIIDDKTQNDINLAATSMYITPVWSNGHCIVRFTAFIDENYYQKDPFDNNNIVGWDRYTRQNDRTMLIASNIQISNDQNSTYSTARTAFIQRSIQTYYNSNTSATTNAMGVETYCENKPFYWVKSEYSNVGQSSINGRANMKEMMNWFKDLKWNDILQISKIGYFTSNTSNYVDHKIDGSDRNGYVYNLLETEYQNSPHHACMSRNRDLNGNGKIDDNEIRWYMPACDQYLRINIGADAMSETSRLFLGDRRDIATGYPRNFYDQGSIYFTSTYDVNQENRESGIKQVLWAAEVGAFGTAFDAQHVNQSVNRGLVRCVRNLPSIKVINKNINEVVVDDDALGDVSYTLKRMSNSNAYIFDFENRLDERIYRVERQYGPYPHHCEEPTAALPADANRLPKGIVVASRSVGEIGDDKATSYYRSRDEITNGTTDPCARYTESGDEANNGYWRVPNLREMMVISTQADVLGFFDYERLSVDDNGRMYYFITATDFSGRDDNNSNNNRKGFVFQARRNYTNSGFITTEVNGSYVFVRCVRDMTEEDLAGATVVE